MRQEAGKQGNREAEKQGGWEQEKVEEVKKQVPACGRQASLRSDYKLTMSYVPQKIAGFILAGGESSRMGVDKGLLEIDGAPLIVRTARLVDAVAGAATVVGQPKTYQQIGLCAIADDWPGCGPLGGIATALRASDAEWNLIVACDLPYLTREWLQFLARRAHQSAGDTVAPMNERGAEPLCAMYRKSCEPAIRGALEQGTRKVTDGLARLRVEYLEPAEWKCFDSGGLLFKNMNTPEDYEEARTRLTTRANS